MEKLLCLLTVFLMLVSCSKTPEPVPVTPEPEPEREKVTLEIEPEELDVFFLNKRSGELAEADTLIFHMPIPVASAELLRLLQSLPQDKKREYIFAYEDMEYTIDVSSLDIKDFDYHSYPLNTLEKGTVDRSVYFDIQVFKVKEDTGEEYVFTPSNVAVNPGAVFRVPYDAEKSWSFEVGDYVDLQYLWRVDYTEAGVYSPDVYAAQKMKAYQPGLYDSFSEEEIAYQLEMCKLYCADGSFDFYYPDKAVLSGVDPFHFGYLGVDQVTYHWRDQTYTLKREDFDASWFEVIHLTLYIPLIFEKQDFRQSEVEVEVAQITEIDDNSWSGIATIEKGFHNAEEIISSLPLPSRSKVGDYVTVIYTYNKDNGEFTFLELMPADGPGEIPIAKPVIYLYPEEETDVSVRLDFPGRLGATYPQYEEGWNITAYPDGTLEDESGRHYAYLFYEGDMKYEFDLSDAACVKREDSVPFLQETLAKMGLKETEINDFIVYWLPYLEESPYNLISFKNDVYDKLSDLEVTPKPDSILRVYMVFQGTDEEVEGKELEIQPFERKGFTVVEWGGTRLPER
ncbi:MAG: hypothetical protein IIZ33_09005 [Erysipelotrichaceae bacterium]|nr:hypothetical protein [Erysipelotrichaceae bacterium]